MKRCWNFYGLVREGLRAAAAIALMGMLASVSFVEAAPLFDGATFAGWEGDTDSVWRIEAGQIVGGSLDRKQAKNDFLCTTKRYSDFDLRLKIKLSGTNGFVNSGIQFRSERVAGSHEVIGYQADFGHGHDGALYDESRRKRFLVRPADEVLQSVSQPGQWHDYRIRAEGDHIQLWVNGIQTVDYTETEPGLPKAGVIALQIHGNATAEVRFKDLEIQELPPVRRAQAGPPNVLFILADDLGYRELGCYGQKRIQTPCVDRLATEGVRLTRHYAGNAVCAPSRCVLLTGKHPGHAFVRDNRSTPPEGQISLPAAEQTIAAVLQVAGYATGAYGKWGLGGPGSTGDPLRQGLDHFFGYNCQAHAHSYYPSYLWDDDQRIVLANNPPVPGHAGLAQGTDPKDPRSYDRFKGAEYAPDRIHAAAIDFLRSKRDQPFFLYYPSTLPHLALHIPDKDLEPYLKQGWNDPPFTKPRGGYTPHFTPRAAYAAMISRLDTEVGSLLDVLEEMGVADNTLVVFTSDNGTSHLRQEVDYEFFESVGALRGLKGSLYEGGVRVPCVVRWPGKIPAGTTSDVLSGFEDWLPTIMAAAGLQTLAGPATDGRNLLPALMGKASPDREFLYREFQGYGGQQAVWSGRWKAIRQQLQKRAPKTELYDLEDDPGEKRDVAAVHPAVLAQLEVILQREHTPSEVFPLHGLDGARVK
jgi:arylsulfatase A